VSVSRVSNSVGNTAYADAKTKDEDQHGRLGKYYFLSVAGYISRFKICFWHISYPSGELEHEG